MNASAVLSGFVGGLVVVLFSIVVVLVQRWHAREPEPKPEVARCQRCQRTQSYVSLTTLWDVGWQEIPPAAGTSPKFMPAADMPWLCPFCVREQNTSTCAGGCGATKLVGDGATGWGLDRDGRHWCPACEPAQVKREVEEMIRKAAEAADDQPSR